MAGGDVGCEARPGRESHGTEGPFGTTREPCGWTAVTGAGRGRCARRRWPEFTTGDVAEVTACAHHDVRASAASLRQGVCRVTTIGRELRQDVRACATSRRQDESHVTRSGRALRHDVRTCAASLGQGMRYVMTIGRVMRHDVRACVRHEVRVVLHHDVRALPRHYVRARDASRR